MQLADFKIKAVQGLYHYDHFEAANGAFIQRHVRGDDYVYQDVNGDRFKFDTIEQLKDHLAEETQA